MNMHAYASSNAQIHAHTCLLSESTQEIKHSSSSRSSNSISITSTTINAPKTFGLHRCLLHTHTFNAHSHPNKRCHCISFLDPCLPFVVCHIGYTFCRPTPPRRCRRRHRHHHRQPSSTQCLRQRTTNSETGRAREKGRTRVRNNFSNAQYIMMYACTRVRARTHIHARLHTGTHSAHTYTHVGLTHSPRSEQQRTYEKILGNIELVRMNEERASICAQIVVVAFAVVVVHVCVSVRVCVLLLLLLDPYHTYIYYMNESGDLLRLRNVHEAHIHIYYTGWFRSFVGSFVRSFARWFGDWCLFVVLCCRYHVHNIQTHIHTDTYGEIRDVIICFFSSENCVND